MTDKKDARKAIEDLDLEAHLARAGRAATAFAQGAVSRAGGFARDHRETAHDWLDRAEGEVDRVTGGRGRAYVATVRSGLASGVDAVADQAPDEAGGGSDGSTADGGAPDPASGPDVPDADASETGAPDTEGTDR